MKWLIVIIMISAFLCLPSIALAVKGVVVYVKSGCSYYIVETPLGYTLLQWFGGSIPSRGDVLVGDYESYGMKDIYNITQDSETKVWVDSFWMSKDHVIERFFEKCH
ncbi:MAG: hypothetical protein WHS46_10195 [Desulfosoma sp.]